jgi:hypothetical protein
MSLKDYYPVRREQSDILDTAVIGGGVEGLLCALSLSELEAVSVKVWEPAWVDDNCFDHRRCCIHACFDLVAYPETFRCGHDARPTRSSKQSFSKVLFW